MCTKQLVPFVVDTFGASCSCIEAERTRNRTAKHENVLMQRAPDTGPQFDKLTIPKEAVGRLIGPGGSSIHALQDRHDARIVVTDNGVVHTFTTSNPQSIALKSAIEALTGMGLQVSSQILA